MLDKLTAERILQEAENEMEVRGTVGFNTVIMIKNTLENTGKDFTDYFYPDGQVMRFNSARFKRHFLIDR